MTTPTADAVQLSGMEQRLLGLLADVAGGNAALADTVNEKNTVIESLRADIRARDKRISDLEGLIAQKDNQLRERAASAAMAAAETAGVSSAAKFSFSFGQGGAAKKRTESVHDGPPFFGKPGPVVGHFGIGLPGELGQNNTVRGTDGVFR